jgi:hypothetical protein
MNHKIVVVSILIALITLVACQRQEESAEPPEAQAPQLSADRVKEAIMVYLENNTGEDGTFALEDSVESRTRQLTYGYVHDSVNETEDGRYAACVDFTDGADTLDVDFYVSPSPAGAAEVSEVVIHKVNGESRLGESEPAEESAGS